MKRLYLSMIAWTFLSLPTQGESRSTPCLSQKAAVDNAPFAKYPARIALLPWTRPDVRVGDAHLYRTVLGRDGAGPPDFAGIYRLVLIGCGAGSACPAFVNRKTGHVTFTSELRVVSWMPHDVAPDDTPGPERLTYRLSSRLLVVLGMTNENVRTAGLSIYDWRGDRLHLIRFIPQAKLCPRGSDR